MSETIELPGGHNATLKTSDELSNKDMKVIRRAGSRAAVVAQRLKDLGFEAPTNDAEEGSPEETESTDTQNLQRLTAFADLNDDESDQVDLFQRTCAAVRLLEWSLDLPLPKTPEDVDNLPRGIYDALTTVAVKLDLNETFGMEHAADPKAPAEDLAVSELHSPVEPLLNQ